MNEIIAKSPDNQHIAILNNIGEIRFGPAYYSLSIDDLNFRERIFGKDYLWSPDSHFLAVQEWRSIEYNQGPQTQLLILDVINHKECVLSGANEGFIVPKAFEANKIIYTKEYWGKGILKEFEMDFLNLERWKNLDGK